MDEITRLARPEILQMKPYSSARKEGEQKNMSVYLDANENPFAPYPAGQDCTGLNRYPEPQPDVLLNLFARHYGVQREQLLISRGADEAIRLLVTAFCSAGKDAVLLNPPTFGMYEIAAKIQNAAIYSVPFRKGDNFQLNVDEILNQCRTHADIKLVFVCTPNNPTGGLIRKEDIFQLCSELFGKALIIADETYVEFSGQPSLCEEVKARPNLVVLRTVSKEYSLAGERCGITIANPQVISLIGRILDPYPLTASAIRIVTKAMSPEGIKQARENMRLILEQRNVVEQALKKFPTVKHIYPSDANYLLIETTDPKLLVRMMENAGIKIRDRSDVSGIEGCVRISIGTSEQNQAMLEVFEKYSEKSLV